MIDEKVLTVAREIYPDSVAVVIVCKIDSQVIIKELESTDIFVRQSLSLELGIIAADINLDQIPALKEISGIEKVELDEQVHTL